MPLTSREDPGSKPGTLRLHVVPGGLLELEPQDVLPGPRCSEELYLERKSH